MWITIWHRRNASEWKLHILTEVHVMYVISNGDISICSTLCTWIRPCIIFAYMDVLYNTLPIPYDDDDDDSSNIN